MPRCMFCLSLNVEHSVKGTESGTQHLCRLCYLRIKNYDKDCLEVKRRVQENIELFDLEYLYALPSPERGT